MYLIIGKSSIGMALCKIAKQMDYRVTALMASADAAVYPTADRVLEISKLENTEALDGAYVVVCSQGDGDVTALLKSLEIESNYIRHRRKATRRSGYQYPCSDHPTIQTIC